MKKLVIMVLMVCVFLIVLSGCYSGEIVNVHNWGEFIDESIFKIFEEETGIRVKYSTYETNEQLYALLRRGGTDIDVIIPSDYLIARLIAEDMLEELDFSNIPNFSLVDDRFKGLEYDPNNKYSVAYMTGTVGLIYNSAFINEELTSWSALWDERFSGQILMFDNPRDAFGVALRYLGYYQNTTVESEIREAFELLVKQKPLLQAYVMDQIYDKLESGEAWLGPFYAGPYFVMRENNPDLVFARPVEGSNFFVDAMCVPKGASNKTNAEIFIDFMSRTDIALLNMEEVWYASANAEAAILFAQEHELNPRDFEIMFASDETLANCDVFTHLPLHVLELYDQLWIELKR
ncbi:MAG: spermidine/putrescine ABC transporter substrate-binding protein [Oscillospiraceae bacterium]|jgi:spermidine/putrescine-binding protein|nr:spermidine/putrescine ABC transporter substrate-binding protein [Oscillospiraceae bacterium]